jgi:exopolysaccharide production protein ExoZ
LNDIWTEIVSKAAESRILWTLEAGRFLAALAVVLFHYSVVLAKFRGAEILGGLTLSGHFGVKYFFVLSGFIIFYNHSADFGQPGAVRNFMLRRAIRLLPAFWLISLLTLAACVVWPSIRDVRDLTPLGLLSDFLLLPHLNALVAVSWTLRHEVVFYLLFAIALARTPRTLWLVAAWIIISLAGAAYALDVGFVGFQSIWSSALNLGFGLGILVAFAVKRFPPGDTRLPLMLGGGGLLALVVLEMSFREKGHLDVLSLGMPGEVGYIIMAAVLIYALVQWEKTRPAQEHRIWNMLGGCSYMLYLVHSSVGSLFIRMPFARHLPPDLAYGLMVLLAIVVAIALHLWVEKPVLRWLKHRLIR